MSDTDKLLSSPEGRQQAAQLAMNDRAVLDGVIEMLEASSRVKRQQAAGILGVIAKENPQLLSSDVSILSEAAMRPEPYTRWECLNALSDLCEAGISVSNEVVDAAEESLFDEGNGIAREAAFRLCCAYGKTSPSASEEVFSLIDEAVQCHHGNAEFPNMLLCLVDFAEGNISLEVSRALAKRFDFDAKNARGTLRVRAEQIIEANKEREK